MGLEEILKDKNSSRLILTIFVIFIGVYSMWFGPYSGNIEFRADTLKLIRDIVMTFMVSEATLEGVKSLGSGPGKE